MADYSNLNTGIAFTNDRRTKATQPQFSGSFCLNSEDRTHKLFVYGRVDKAGAVYMDAQFVEQDAQGSIVDDGERFAFRLDPTNLTNDKAPKFKGTGELPNGDEMSVAVWLTSINGKPALSFREEVQQEGSAAVNRDEIVDLFGSAPVQAEQAVSDFEDNFDDVPF
jgi:hypothetical protein